MSVNRMFIPAAPEAVFEVLGDARRYADWVVGAKEIRGVEGDWPSPGARFYHSIGAGPIKIKDLTEVIRSDAPECLVLEARVRPFLIALVTLTVKVHGEGSDVVMEETPMAPLPMRLAKPLLDPFTSRRNMTALRRLRELVVSRSGG